MDKTSYRFDLNLVRKDVKKIQSLYPDLQQICLTHTPTVTGDKVLEGVGSNYNYDSKTYRFDETEFVKFNDDFEDTYLYEIYKAIPNIGRFRIMNMIGPSAYTIHRDQTKRYHLAVDTNRDCLFLFPILKKMYHIPADGYVYTLDTRMEHTFLNGSKSLRTHLVFDDITVYTK